ncbi:MAG: ribonuclease H-like domain-containing protein [Candidatus Thermoplasmatota archaeon]|nr:ribonuclease H-like domain-containing protein [Candidatus Thermoplasmatota archaeon]
MVPHKRNENVLMAANNEIWEELVPAGVAFLDIETTGLSPSACEITMIGILKHDGFHPLVSNRNLDRLQLEKTLRGVERIYTFNGARFDLPFIRAKMGVDLKVQEGLEHVDLMYVCRRRGFVGGQKKIEECLHLLRDTRGMSGFHAAKLGKKWLEKGDLDALDRLVHYNEEDVENLARIWRLVGMEMKEENGSGD